MHSIVGRPFLFFFFFTVLNYAVIGFVEGTVKNTLWTAWLTSILLFIISLIASVLEGLFFKEYFEQDDRISLPESIWGILNTLMVTTHIVANIGFIIYLLDFSDNKNMVFLSVPGEKGGYQSYIAGFLVTASNFVMQTGIIPIQLSESSIIGALWSVFGGFVGVVLVVLLISIVMRSVTQHLYVGRRIKIKSGRGFV